MSQPNTLESFFQMLNATNVWDFKSEAPKTGNPEDLEAEPSNKGVEPDPAGNNGNRRKRVCFTQQQVEGLEVFFKENHRPSRNQRNDVGRLLGLTPLQIRLWFEKRRKKWNSESTERENTLLKAENEKLRAENAKYKEALDTPCSKCRDKTTLEDDMNVIFAITSKYVKEPPAPSYSHLPSSSRSPYPSQTQLAPIEPTSMPSEKGGMHHPGWSYPDDELAVVLDQFGVDNPKL